MRGTCESPTAAPAFLISFVPQAEIVGDAFSDHAKTFTYRYNTANPTSGSSVVEHAAENWMMFRGTNTG